MEAKFIHTYFDTTLVVIGSVFLKLCPLLFKVHLQNWSCSFFSFFLFVDTEASTCSFYPCAVQSNNTSPRAWSTDLICLTENGSSVGVLSDPDECHDGTLVSKHVPSYSSSYMDSENIYTFLPTFNVCLELLTNRAKVRVWLLYGSKAYNSPDLV